MLIPFAIVGPGILVIDADDLVKSYAYKRQTDALEKIKDIIFRSA
jgi:hypothetical protein